MAQPLAAQMKTHKTELLVGALGLGAAALYYLRTRSSSSTTSSTVVQTPTGTVGTGVATTTGTDAYNGMENQILGLQAAVVGLGAAHATSGGVSTTTGQATTPSPTPTTAGTGATTTSGATGGSGATWWWTPTHATGGYPTATAAQAAFLQHEASQKAGSGGGSGSGGSGSGGGGTDLYGYNQEAYAGSGYYIATPKGGRATGSEQAGTGKTWTTLPDLPQTIAAMSHGADVGYESSLGVWTPITSPSQLSKVEGPSNQTTTWISNAPAAAPKAAPKPAKKPPRRVPAGVHKATL
jgi:hypothetical protein